MHSYYNINKIVCLTLGKQIQSASFWSIWMIIIQLPLGSLNAFGYSSLHRNHLSLNRCVRFSELFFRSRDFCRFKFPSCGWVNWNVRSSETA